VQDETITRCCCCHGESLTRIDPVANLMRCGRCDYVFVSPRPAVQSIVEYYSQPQKFDGWLADEKERDELWKRRLRLMDRTKKRGSLLDVGTGTGQMLHHARNHYTAVTGTEVSDSAIRVAKEKYGLDLVQGRLEHLSLAGTFDNISLFHVLEHVPDPRLLLERCRQLLAPHGVLVIAVPNDLLCWQLRARTLLARRKNLLPASVGVFGIPRMTLNGSVDEIHLSQFTPKSLRNLVQSLGFTVLTDSVDPYYVKKGKKLLLHDLYYRFHKVLKAVFGINRYSTILLVCRKPA
jgi:SAM-dependent methyltransferase